MSERRARSFGLFNSLFDLAAFTNDWSKSHNFISWLLNAT